MESIRQSQSYRRVRYQVAAKNCLRLDGTQQGELVLPLGVRQLWVWEALPSPIKTCLFEPILLLPPSHQREIATEYVEDMTVDDLHEDREFCSILGFSWALE
jgi:hypothetical protein